MMFYAALCIGLLSCLSLQAQENACFVPPAPYPVQLPQPDGTTVAVIAKGAPGLIWKETPEGYTVVENEQGFLEYAIKVKGKLLPNGIRAVDASSFQSPPAFLQKHLQPEVSATAQQLSLSPVPLGSATATDKLGPMPSKGDIHLLAILVEYPNYKHTRSMEEIDRLLNGRNGDSPSFAEYMEAASYGKFRVTVDMTGWYMADFDYHWYGQQWGFGRAQWLARMATSRADKHVDYSKYDNDHDGAVDGLIFIHAGPGAEEGDNPDLIWSHRSQMGSFYHDGVTTNDYCILPELSEGNHLLYPGPLVHEFSHLFGLPDLYSWGGRPGIGEWDLMALGVWNNRGRNPADMSAWSKEMLGWLEPVNMTGKDGDYTLPASSTGKAFRINTPNPSEYFLLENRQQQGLDSHLPGSGMAIWHVNMDKFRVGNNQDYQDRLVDMEEASGATPMDYPGYRGAQMDVFPCISCNHDAFSHATTPSSDNTHIAAERSDARTGVDIADIRMAKGKIYFSYQDDLSTKEEKKAQQISFTKPADKYYHDKDFLLEVSASSKLPVTLKVKQGPIKLEDQKVHLQGVGEVVIQASQPGNEVYAPAETVNIKFKILPLKQQISFAAIEDQVYGNPDLKLSASSDQKLPVIFKALTTNIRIQEGKLKILSSGEARVEASQPGNDTIAAAQAVVQSFQIKKLPQTLTFEPIADKFVEDPAFALKAYTDTGLKAKIRVIEGEALILLQHDSVHLLAPGKVVLEAFQKGDENHEAAKPVREAFMIYEHEKLPQSITLSALPDTVTVLTELPLSISTSSGLDPLVQVTGPGEVQGKVLQVQGAGEIHLTITQAGDDTYKAAERIEIVLYAQKIVPIISFDPVAVLYLDEAGVALKAVSSNGEAVQFRLTAGKATLTGSLLSATEEGTLTLEAFVAESELYQQAVAAQTITVKAHRLTAQVLSCPVIEDQVFGEGPVSLSYSSNSSEPVEVMVAGPASYAEGKLMLTGAGRVTIYLFQQGNEVYAPSDTVSLSFLVAKASQQLSLEVIELTDTTYRLEGSSTSGLVVSYQVTKGNASLQEDRLTVHESGEVVVTALQAGNDNYEAGEAVAYTLSVEIITALEDIPGSQEIQVYPNPTTGWVHLSLPMDWTSCGYQLFNSQAVLLEQGEIRQPALNLSSRASGLYLLRLEHEGEVQYVRVVKE